MGPRALGGKHLGPKGPRKGTSWGPKALEETVNVESMKVSGGVGQWLVKLGEFLRESKELTEVIGGRGGSW